MHRELQRQLTVETLLKHRISAPAEWIGASDQTTQCDPLDWLNEGEERNLALRLVDGLIELRVKAPDKLWSEGFYEACRFLKVDARFAYGVHWGSSVLMKIDDPATIDRWRDVWPRGFKSANAWIETSFEHSFTGTKPLWRSSAPLPGSTVDGDLVYWRPGGKPPAEALDVGLEDLELRPVAPTNMESICRAIAYATLAYWIRADLEGLEDWGGMLTRQIGGWLARVAREGAAINAPNTSTADKCWSPVAGLTQADQLVAFLQKHVHAPGELNDRLHKADAELSRNSDARVPGWTSLEERFGIDGMQGVRRAFRAGLDISELERLAEIYVLDTTTHLYVDRSRIPQGLKFEFEHAALMRQHANNKINFGKKSYNAFDLFSKSKLRIDVKATDFLPSVQPGAITRYSPILGLLNEERSHHDEYPVVNSFPGFPVQPVQTPDPKIARYVRKTLTRLFGLLTRHNDKQMLWLEKWIAWIIQNPHKKQQVAPVFIGGQGIGKSRFGVEFMRALFGGMAGRTVMAKDDKFVVTPFIGKLVTFVDEVRMESVSNINMLKQLIREDRMPGQMKNRDHMTYYLPTRLVLASNTADIGLTAEDQGDRALFFIRGYTADHLKLTKQEFNDWTAKLKPFYDELVERLTHLDVRQHLVRHFMDVKVTRAELEDLTHSSRDDEEIVRATMPEARKVAMHIVCSAHVVGARDITAWFTKRHIREAIKTEVGFKTSVTEDQVLLEWRRAEVVEDMRGGWFRFKWGYGKLLAQLSKAWSYKLEQVFDFEPDDFNDNPVIGAAGGREWRGFKHGFSDESARGGFANQRRHPDDMDPF